MEMVSVNILLYLQVNIDTVVEDYDDHQRQQELDYNHQQGEPQIQFNNKFFIFPRQYTIFCSEPRKFHHLSNPIVTLKKNFYYERSIFLPRCKSVFLENLH